jgi:hypothetical protein
VIDICPNQEGHRPIINQRHLHVSAKRALLDTVDLRTD